MLSPVRVGYRAVGSRAIVKEINRQHGNLKPGPRLLRCDQPVRVVAVSHPTEELVATFVTGSASSMGVWNGGYQREIVMAQGQRREFCQVSYTHMGSRP